MVCEAAVILKIEETDFGCEGRPENVEVMAKIILETVKERQQVILDVEENCLWQMGLDEGMQVNLIIQENGTAMIQK